MPSRSVRGGSTRASCVVRNVAAEDWEQWHSLYDESPALQERLILVREHICGALLRQSAEPVHIISICAGDGRDVTGALAASDRRKKVQADLFESNAQLVAHGQAAVNHVHLNAEVTFHCADATQSSTYRDLSRAHVVVLAGVFGNLKDEDVPRLITSLKALCHPGASVVWTRNLVEFDDGERATQMIRDSFSAAEFKEELLARTPRGVFAVATHSFRALSIRFRWTLACSCSRVSGTSRRRSANDRSWADRSRW